MAEARQEDIVKEVEAEEEEAQEVLAGRQSNTNADTISHSKKLLSALSNPPSKISVTKKAKIRSAASSIKKKKLNIVATDRINRNSLAELQKASLRQS